MVTKKKLKKDISWLKWKIGDQQSKFELDLWSIQNSNQNNSPSSIDSQDYDVLKNINYDSKKFNGTILITIFEKPLYEVRRAIRSVIAHNFFPIVISKSNIFFDISILVEEFDAIFINIKNQHRYKNFSILLASLYNKSKYLFFLDADDYIKFQQDDLSNFVNFLKKTNVDVIFNSAYMEKEDFFYKELALGEFHFSNCSLIIKNDVLKKNINIFLKNKNFDVVSPQDVILMLAIINTIKNFKFEKIDIPFYFWTNSNSGIVRSNPNKTLGLNVLNSLYNNLKYYDKFNLENFQPTHFFKAIDFALWRIRYYKTWKEKQVIDNFISLVKEKMGNEYSFMLERHRD